MSQRRAGGVFDDDARSLEHMSRALLDAERRLNNEPGFQREHQHVPSQPNLSRCNSEMDGARLEVASYSVEQRTTPDDILRTRDGLIETLARRDPRDVLRARIDTMRGNLRGVRPGERVIARIGNYERRGIVNQIQTHNDGSVEVELVLDDSGRDVNVPLGNIRRF